MSLSRERTRRAAVGQPRLSSCLTDGLIMMGSSASGLSVQGLRGASPKVSHGDLLYLKSQGPTDLGPLWSILRNQLHWSQQKSANELQLGLNGVDLAPSGLGRWTRGRSRPMAGYFSNIAHHIAATRPSRRPGPSENGPDAKSLFKSSRAAGLGFVS